MSSLRMSSRVRQKSPPLHPASASVVKSAASGNSDLIGETVSGIGKRPVVSAATTPTARRGTLSRPAAPARLIALTLDANDRKDQHGASALKRSELRS
jgi:hypothetical protein